jgi:hypothetical protein
MIKKNTTQRTKDWATRTTLKARSSLRCSGKVGSYCTTSGTRRITLVTIPMLKHEWGKNRIVITTNGHLWYRYPVTVDQVVLAYVILNGVGIYIVIYVTSKINVIQKLDKPNSEIRSSWVPGRIWFKFLSYRDARKYDSPIACQVEWSNVLLFDKQCTVCP